MVDGESINIRRGLRMSMFVGVKIMSLRYLLLGFNKCPGACIEIYAQLTQPTVLVLLI